LPLPWPLPLLPLGVARTGVEKTLTKARNAKTLRIDLYELDILPFKYGHQDISKLLYRTELEKSKALMRKNGIEF
jgi:hypothetical protein